MTEFNWQHNWKWAGPFLWLTVHYDHRFEALTDGRTKITFIIAEARAIGYKRMLLDTLPSMQAAMKLYELLGFKDIAPYRYNPIAGTRFMELDLNRPHNT